MRRIAAWVLVAASVAWGTAIIAAPLVNDAPRMTAVSYLVGALVCHQRPERSFHVAGAQLPVCARCAALYWGGAIGLAGWMLTRSRRGGSLTRRTLFARTIVILGVPIAITLLTSALGLWDPTNTVRAISSAPFGIALGASLAAVVLGDLR